MNVLLSCAGRRAYLVSWFRRAVEPAGRVLVTNSEPDSAAMVVADAAFVAPPLARGDYACYVLELCRREEVGLVVPLFDLELPLLAAARDRFAAAGIVVAVSSPDVVATCRDKLATVDAVRGRTTLAVPRTTLDAEEAAGWIVAGAAGVFVKPRFGTGSIAMVSTTQADEVAVLQRKVRRDLRATYLRHATPAGEDDVVIQETLPGQEYGLTVVNDFAGVCRAVLVNRKLAMRAGETDVAVTEEHDLLAAAGRQLGETLGHVGALDVDVFLDGLTVSVLDVNARLGGNYPFSHLAGADVPRAYVCWAQGRPVDDAWFEARPGVVGLKSIEPLRVSP